MKSIVVCEATFSEERDKPEVLKEMEIENKKSSTLNLTPDEGNGKPLTPVDSSKEFVKHNRKEKTCMEDLERNGLDRGARRDPARKVETFEKRNTKVDRENVNACGNETSSIKSANSKDHRKSPYCDNPNIILEEDDEGFIKVIGLKKTKVEVIEISEKFNSQEEVSEELDGGVRNISAVNKLRNDVSPFENELQSVQSKNCKKNDLCDVSADKNVEALRLNGKTSEKCSTLKEPFVVENEEPEENLILEKDENKENEKNFKAKSDRVLCLNLDDSGSECSKLEIRVGECQTVQDSEASMWNKMDTEKSEKNNEPDFSSDGVNEKESESIIKKSIGSEANTKINKDENLIGEKKTCENEEMKLESSDNSACKNIGESVSDFADANSNSYSGSKRTEIFDWLNSKKRKINNAAESTTPKRKRLSVDLYTSEIDATEGDKNCDSSLCNNSPDREDFLNADCTGINAQVLEEGHEWGKKHNGWDEESKKTSNYQDKVAATSSFLNTLRGTLKNLTRSDLEELIVQKLCEVITERSTVGELRRKAQTLEEDQERWRTKVQSLSKQIREMEMVMKKYIFEVQKRAKEGNTNLVVPLRVTRSVGLQVSFFSNVNKTQKPRTPQGNNGQKNVPSVAQTPIQSPNVAARNGKLPPQKSPSQSGIPNVRTKPGPASQKVGAVSQKSPVPPPKKANYPIAPAPQTLINNKSPQVQPLRNNYKLIPALQCSPTQVLQQQQQQQLQQPQQRPQQNGSKVIDLTDDDDRQSTVVLKSSCPIRVVNHASQSQVPPNNRVAYILPTTSTVPAIATPGQNRQVLIATPAASQSNRQVMSMPPLFFKGCNTSQPSSQPQTLNQPNRVIMPKILKHPAPLPQQPISQFQKSNLKLLPPRPALKISRVQTGIVLSWNMSLGPEHAPISSYQLYAYQEGESPPDTSLWKKVGDVKALPLPMACTLTQFMSGHKYHFAVRAVDRHSRIGPFSYPATIVLIK